MSVVAGYLVILLPLHAWLGDSSLILSAIPMAILSWYLGVRVGLVAGLLMLLASLGLLWSLEGSVLFEVLHDGGPAIAILLIVIGWLAGLMGEAQKFYAVELEMRHQTEKLLRAKEQQLQSVVASNVDGMIVVDANSGEIQFANPSACALFDRHLPELIGLQLGAPLVVGESVELDLPHRDGTTGVAEMRVVPLDWNGNSAYLASLRDITDNKRTQQELMHYALEISALYDTVTEINAHIDLRTLLRAIAQRAGKLVNAPISELYLVAPDNKNLDLVASTNSQVTLTQFPIEQGLAGYVIRTATPYVVQDYAHWEHRIEALAHHKHQPIGRAMGVPLRIKDQALGAITVADYGVGTFDERMVRLLELFADQAAIAVENARLYDAVQQMAVTDELTGLYNRHGFFQLSKHEIERAARLAEPIGLIILDVDHFKQVNDQYGHAMGDRVLRTIAQTCQMHVRAIDVVGRYGGEEIIILLPRADSEMVRAIAERLRIAIAEIHVPLEWSAAVEVRVTASFGVTCVNDNLMYDLEELIRRADGALYQAKQMGRNAVITAN